MKSLERVRRSIAGKNIDYLPFFPEVIAAACQITGVNQSSYSNDSDIMANALIAVRELCDYDGIYVSRDNLVLHQALGGEVIFPVDDEPLCRQALLGSVEEYRKLSIPSPQKAPGMKTVLEAAKIVQKRVGEDYYIQANIDSGPFEMAAILMGVERFLGEALSIDKKLMHKFLSFCTDVVVEYGRAMIGTGVHGVQFGDSVASLVGPEMFEKYVLPYQQKTVSGLSNKGSDIWIHICGNTKHIIPLLSNVGIQGFEVDSAVPLSEARELIGNRIALKGNLNTTFLLTKKGADVYRETQAMIRSGGLKTALIVSPGCGVPRMTPIENLAAMERACRDYRL